MESFSRTALMVAAYRARASSRPSPLIHDPWAAALAGPEGFEVAQRFDATFPPMELWMAVRVAWVEARMRTLHEQGVRQFVLLGAGLDTRAARMALEGARFFEVDHPLTQAEKLARVRALEGYRVDAATYVPCDFEVEGFADKLLGAPGFDPHQPAMFVWEGVTPYLTVEAVRATLTALAGRFHPQSVVVFDYVGKGMVSAQDTPNRATPSREALAGMGEPMRFGTDDVVGLLASCGFRFISSAPFDAACLEVEGSYDRARGFRFQHLAWASVGRKVGGGAW